MRMYLFFAVLVLMAAGCAPGDRQSTPAGPPAAATRPPSATFIAPTETQQPTVMATATAAPSVTQTLPPTPTLTPTPEPVILIGAGDIAACGEDGDERTAAILERFPEAAIFTSGDNVYDKGRAIEYTKCFGESWGRFKDRIRPSPGNHDYATEQGAPYYAYFGEQAGEPGKGYYSYDLGEWHIVALNSNCNDVACGPNSAQVAWLKADLAASEKRCTLAYWHHPRFTSALSGNYGAASPFWRALYEAGAEVVINGHDHSYERFAPQDPDANPDPNGIRAFVVGTGGSYLRLFAEPQPNSEVRQIGTLGVIKFTLYPDRYEWEFISAEGDRFTDSGSGDCH